MPIVKQQPIPKPFESHFAKAGVGLKHYQSAEIVSRSNHPQVFDSAFKKLKCGNLLKQLGLTELLPGMNYRFIRITPQRIKYVNPREGVFRVTWKSA
jgi:hypothetical protein